MNVALDFGLLDKANMPHRPLKEKWISRLLGVPKCVTSDAGLGGDKGIKAAMSRGCNRSNLTNNRRRDSEGHMTEMSRLMTSIEDQALHAVGRAKQTHPCPMPRKDAHRDKARPLVDLRLHRQRVGD